MSTFDSWHSFYADKFDRISNDALQGYWWLYGRDAENDSSPRELAAWAAVNAEMQSRGL